MVHIERKNPDVITNISNDEVTIVVDALFHELERYNQAEALVMDSEARQTIRTAKAKVLKVYNTFCSLLHDEELNPTL
jgi:hypothetical protein